MDSHDDVQHFQTLGLLSTLLTYPLLSGEITMVRFRDIFGYAFLVFPGVIDSDDLHR
jgi:hypothetical protein